MPNIRVGIQKFLGFEGGSDEGGIGFHEGALGGADVLFVLVITENESAAVAGFDGVDSAVSNTGAGLVDTGLVWRQGWDE